MRFLRILHAPPNPLLEKYAASTGRTVQDAVAETPAAWIPAPEHPEIWAALAAVGNSPGVIDHTDPALANPARD